MPCMYHLFDWCLGKSTEGADPLDLELQLVVGPMEEQLVLLVTGPSLHSPICLFFEPDLAVTQTELK